MNVQNKTTRTFTIAGITEDQAHDLLRAAARTPEDAYRTASEVETLNNLRQALLGAGITLNKG